MVADCTGSKSGLPTALNLGRPCGTIVLKTTVGQQVFTTLAKGINRLLGFAGVGAAFVFGPLGDNSVWSRAMTGALGPAGQLGTSIIEMQDHVTALQKNIDTLKKVKAALGG